MFWMAFAYYIPLLYEEFRQKKADYQKYVIHSDY